MVQAARLDLIRIAASALLVAACTVSASAQPLAPVAPLLQERPLTSLLVPQKLDQSRPLLRQPAPAPGTVDPATGRATPCTRPARPAGATPSAFGGGSGPGDYGRYLPNAPSGGATPAPPAAPGQPVTTPPTNAASSARAPGGDRPLIGGTERPLWDTGERRAAAAGKPASAGADKTALAAPDGTAADGTVSGATAPVPARDRPLWADGSAMASMDSGTGSGIAAAPCPDAATPLAR